MYFENFNQEKGYMDIQLTKKIDKPLIIEGFPGFGLIGAITTEFLISHLECEMIGEILMEDMPATLAIHQSKLVHPVGIYYNEQYNIVIVHSITAPQSLEWKLARSIMKLADELNAWEIICLEGVGSMHPNDDTKAYFHTNVEENKKKLLDVGIEELKEGIIVGVTSAVMLYGQKRRITSLFGEAHSSLPDSKGAAKIIEILDKYLGLNVDPKPLLETAEKFEDQLKDLIDKTGKVQTQRDEKTLSYVG